MPFDTIRKNSAPELAAEQILKKIEAGELPPGGRLPPQRELARLLGVGRSSIREAINALTVMGYLHTEHGRGTFVRRSVPKGANPRDRLETALSAGSLFDLMEARALLEAKSAALAAERSDAGHHRRLKTVVARLKAIPGADYPAFLSADLDFHFTLAEATGNGVICEMTRLVLEKVAEHHARLRTEHLTEAYRKESVQTAEKVVQNVIRGDGDHAARWMRRHLEAISGELENLL
jgi:GntR family transcriptional repressor for pyruvate dehydrogenase complex